ncbi:CBS domain-containing protein [Paenibacillus sp. N1-5-1-14]|uniref:CBS domain-containing protein n=1 Tax=Paenibacillus radicibacter TaxID=2972488 RepID=UPI0021599223|nr:CBS domain-containing protein [Paenibacillus radicibacter]MCR8645660.1 CBS domain-containing protein [Paenibacillus radicibacter]
MVLAKEIMVNDVIAISNKALMQEVMETLVNNRIGGVPIVDDECKVVGFISDGDIMKNIGSHDQMVIDPMGFTSLWMDHKALEDKLQELASEPVMNIATHRVVSVDVDTIVEKVAEILGKRQIKKVPVLENGKLVGIISRGDLLRKAIEHNKSW